MAKKPTPADDGRDRLQAITRAGEQARDDAMMAGRDPEKEPAVKAMRDAQTEQQRRADELGDDQ